MIVSSTRFERTLRRQLVRQARGRWRRRLRCLVLGHKWYGEPFSRDPWGDPLQRCARCGDAA